VVSAAAIIIIAAIVIPLSLDGGRITPAPVVIPLHATEAAKVSGFGVKPPPGRRLVRMPPAAGTSP
jgi:hypothetical protein